MTERLFLRHRFFQPSKKNKTQKQEATHSRNTLNTEESKMKDIAITENHLYQKAYQRGERAVGKSIAVYVLRDYTAKRQMLKNPQKKYVNRIGLSVSKKIGGAVTRNRAKRLIRASLDAVRKENELKLGYLIVIAARSEIMGASYATLVKELTRAFERLDMLVDVSAPSESKEK